MERDLFLAGVRRSLAAAVLPETVEADPGLRVPDLGRVDLTTHFAAALERADGAVHTRPPFEVIGEIAGRLATDRFISWDEEHLPVPGLLGDLEQIGLRRVDHRHSRDDAGRRQRSSDYQSLLLGITGAEAGFAETGSIVVRSGPGRPRMASLIPAVHIALLPLTSIFRSLAHWAEEMAPEMSTAANVVFISGPSRTGDIEMRLNTGVHGPGEVHVVLI